MRPDRGRSSMRRRYWTCLAHPRTRDLLATRDVVDHQDELMVVIAVHDLDVDAGLGHAARDLAELPRLVLPEPLHQHVARCNHQDPRRLERASGRATVRKE